jgi:hypothetical protein
VDDIFLALSACAALHPDDDAGIEMVEEDGEDNVGWMYTAEDVLAEMNDVRQAALDHLDSVFQGPVPESADENKIDGQFEDA